MNGQVISMMVPWLVMVLVLSMVAAALVWLCERALKVRHRVLRRMLARKIFVARQRADANRHQLKVQCKRDAKTLLTSREGMPIARVDWEYLEQKINKHADDLAANATVIAQAIGSADASVRRTAGRIGVLLAFVLALALFGVYALTCKLFAAEGVCTLWVLADDAATSAYASLGLAAVVVFITAWTVWRFLQMRADSAPAYGDVKVNETEVPVIGEAGRPVRAINFGGGGFDTIMQLGVTHALMVIQGRAPDIVIGVSAGALQAAALAEILQAEPERDAAGVVLSDAERHQARQEARVNRFRDFVAACRKVREDLVDAVTPDAYQVNAHAPLESLKTPVAAQGDRDDRQDAVRVESGLVRFYNDILSLHIPIGTVVRGIRRWLGIKAAGNLPWRKRWWARCVELTRLWLLCGSVIARSGPLIGIAFKAFRLRLPILPTSADSIIFKFPPTRMLRALGKWLGFVPLLVIWLALGLLPGWLVLAVTERVLRQEVDANPWLLLAMLFPYVLPLVVALAACVVKLSWRPIVNTWSGVLEAVWLLTVWTSVIAAGVVGFFFAWAPDKLTLFFQNPVPCVIRIGWVVLAVFALIYTIWLIFKCIDSVMGWWGAARPESRLIQRFLNAYGVSNSLIHPHAIRSLLIDLFDRQYYGSLKMEAVVSGALDEASDCAPREPVRAKRIVQYAGNDKSPIHVGLAVADVIKGSLEVVPPGVKLVDGLLAAVAAVPFLPPVKIGQKLYVDGTNVSTVPTEALFKVLRGHVHSDVHGIYIYSVMPLPFSSEHLYEKKDQKLSLGLWDTVQKALYLQRFRDAFLERRLTELYRSIIPRRGGNAPKYDIEVELPHKKTLKFHRSWTTAIEPDEPIELNKRLLSAVKEERHKIIAEGIADGCRAALEVMIQPAISRVASNGAAPCKQAVLAHLEQRLGKKVALDLPGRDEDTGPGLAEICKACALNRGTAQKKKQHLAVTKTPPGQASLPWPHENEEQYDRASVHIEEDVDIRFQLRDGLSVQMHEHVQIDTGGPLSTDDEPHTDTDTVPGLTKEGRDLVTKRLKEKNWPVLRNGKAGKTRPTVSMLFSGGVFRGVFQMGVLSALDQLNLKPDVVAGASIGSITGAMVAKAFTIEGEKEITKKEIVLKYPARKARVAQLAAVYLGIDRLILTDRFADFVRKLTIRAADTRFTVRQADRVFRKYDSLRSSRFIKNVREVVAGIERLFYINPRQLEELVHCLREENHKGAQKHVKKFVEQWLDKMGVGDQVLGAEPLELLISLFVIEKQRRDRKVDLPFDALLEHGIHMIATATDLTKGGLEAIGGLPNCGERAMLSEALLASSAFPGVFRPRSSLDLYPGTNARRQFIDGGAMDNFPIEPVVHFLRNAWDEKLICDRPREAGNPAPHLVFAASLEVETLPLDDSSDLKRLNKNWVELWRRTRELGYNKKLEDFERAQRHFELIYKQITEGHSHAGEQAPTADELGVGIIPLDIDIMLVKPKWLCGTFSFHPMLGFRQKNQARSIAHGCASTLLRFAKSDRGHRAAWNIDEDSVPKCDSFDDAWTNWQATPKNKRKKGACWLRPNVTCPFSDDALDVLTNLKEGAIPKDQKKPLSEIYKLCKDPTNHRPDAMKAGRFVRMWRKRKRVRKPS